MQGGAGSWVGAVVGVAGEVGDVRRHASSSGEANANGGASQKGRILLDDVGVAGKGSVANVGV